METSSTTPPPQDPDLKGADKPHVTQTLLMGAGGVESNPGPKHLSHSEKEDDFDDILEKVARLIPDNNIIDTLGKALGFDPADIERYIATNTRFQHVTYDGTLKMLRDWRDTRTEATARPALAHALREAKLERLADMPWRTLNVPDLQTTSDDLPQHDLLQSVVKDIKKYYKLNMCTIQADPTNNDVMFEFDHIHVDPTLTEEDRNDKTIRNPLLYCNLLKTKINGELPNRMLVQAEGGAGKTTFCSKIAWDWANDLGFQQFKLVAVIPFRKAKNKTVGEVIKSYLSDNNPFTAAQIDEYILSNQEEVFLVLDGLDELRGKLSDLLQISQIICNRLFMSGMVLVTSRRWRAHEICSITELKKVYAFVHIEGFSVDNVKTYITKFFNQDAASSQELIDFIYNNDVIVGNMAPFPIYIAMLCIMWREYGEERREAMSKLETFSQLFEEMIYLLVDHCGSKDDSQTGPNVQELHRMIPNLLEAVGEIAFQGLLDKRLEFPEDTFQSCKESKEMCCKVGVLTRKKHATTRRDRRKNPGLEMSIVQFPHQLFQEFLAAKYLASLHSSDRDRYEMIMANIVKKEEEFRYLLYFTSAQGSEFALDIVTRLIALERELDPMEQYALWYHEAVSLSGALKCSESNWSGSTHSFAQEQFIVDVAYESQHPSVAGKVGNHLMRSRQGLTIEYDWSAHTFYGLMFIKDHLGKVDYLDLHKEYGRRASEDLAKFILSFASLRTLRIGVPSMQTGLYSICMDPVFYSMLADKVQQCQIQRLEICFADHHDQPLASRAMAEFICQMPHLEILNFCNNILHVDFFLKWASIVSSAKGNIQSTTPHTSLREMIVDDYTVTGWQLCGDTFDSVEKLSIGVLDGFECHFNRWVPEFRGVTELTIKRRRVTDLKFYHVTGEPSTMFKHFRRVFPQLIKMTFSIELSSAILKQILESLRETRGLPLKSVSVQSDEMDDGFDELTALACEINNENVFSVKVTFSTSHSAQLKRL